MRSKGGFIALAVMFSVLLIAGCGGGGGGDSSPAAGLSAPTGVTATAGDNSASIAWSAVAGATSYNLYYSTTTGVPKATATKITGVTTSPRVVTGLTNGTIYFFVVTAVDALGESADSSQVTATPALAPPPAPTGVTATAGPVEATISWSAVAGATSYNIYYLTTSGVTKATGNKLAGRTSPSIVTGLTNGTTYYFIVTAVNAAGEGVESSQVSAAPTAAPPPAAPTGVTSAAGVHEVTVSWTAVTGATSYNVYFDNTTPVTKATINKVTGITTSPKIVTGLVNGTTYYFRVTALNANGESDVSNEASAIPNSFPAPSAPTGVTATAGPGEATISWSAVTGAPSYNVYYSTTTGVTKTTGTKVAGVTSPKAVTGLIRGTPYYFVVTALNSDSVESLDSSQVSATPNAPEPSYSTSDLTGIWNVRVILSGTSPGWGGVTATVNSSGGVSTSDPVGTTTPTFGLLSTTSGTGVSAGVISNTSNATFYGKMSSSKNLIVGTSTLPDGTVALHVFVKRVPGVTFSSTDLANTTIAYHKINRGGSNDWGRGTGSINGAGLMTLTTVDSSSGFVSPPSPASISVNSTTGIVSIPAESSFSGVMTPDKKIIVGTSTDSPGVYSLRIIQMRGQAYTQADLAGVNEVFATSGTSTSSTWTHGEWSTDLVGNVTTGILYNSDGTTTPAGISFTQIIDPQGNVPGGGMLSFGKDLFVENGDSGDGSYITIKVQ